MSPGSAAVWIDGDLLFTLEGMNNKIKVIKRTAYGFRDTEYFFLKIKHAFPGK